jgi:hypothetical protein
VRCEVGPETQGGPLALCRLRSAISYKYLVWWPGCQTASAKKKLSKVRGLACLGITGATRTTPAGAMEALDGLPHLYLVIKGEVRSAAHRLWNFWCWSYLHPKQENIFILTRLQKSDPTFNTGFDVMKPVFNLEPKYKVCYPERNETEAPGLGSMGNLQTEGSASL